MSDTQFVRYIGPHDSVDVVIAGEPGRWWAVERGATVEVPTGVAGRGPRPAHGVPADADYEPADPGEGLLAQTDNWEPVAQRAGRQAVRSQEAAAEPAAADGTPPDASSESETAEVVA